MPHDCPCSTVTIRSSIWTAALHGDAARVHYLLHVSKRMCIFIYLFSTQAVKVVFPVVLCVSNPVPVGKEGWKENKARCVGWWRLYPSSLFCAGMPIYMYEYSAPCSFTVFDTLKIHVSFRSYYANVLET